jgi:hypothetical protein
MQLAGRQAGRRAGRQPRSSPGGSLARSSHQKSQQEPAHPPAAPPSRNFQMHLQPPTHLLLTELLPLLAVGGEEGGAPLLTPRPLVITQS